MAGVGPSGSWIQSATARMKKKGTIGAFGRATPAKIAAGKAKGGLMKKRAIFAQNMKKIAQNRTSSASDEEY